MIGTEFIDYLVSHRKIGTKRLPPLTQISKETRLGVGKLREQMAVARALGLIDAAPKRGIENLSYDFLPAVRMSLEAGIALNEDCFPQFADLRNRLESSYWKDAARKLTAADIAELQCLCDAADAKLEAVHREIPHQEHRDFHLKIFSHLDNPFVLGLLTAYWDAYQMVAPKYYEDLAHLREAWRYHRQIVTFLEWGDLDRSHELHVEHMSMLELQR